MSRRPTFLQGVLFAAFVSIVGSMLSVFLLGFVSAEWVFRGIIILFTSVYAVYLMSVSQRRIGKVSLTLCLLMSSCLLWYLQTPAIVFAISHMLLICLIRSFYFHANILGLLMDLMLGVIGIGASVWAAEQSGSLFLVFWCFFLVQSLFVYIPRRWRGDGSVNKRLSEDRFQRAFQSANSALKRLSANKLEV